MIEVFRDDWLLVVDKPSGLPTQGTRDGEPGLFEILRETEPALALHHRLDQPTSGLVLLSRSAEVNASLTRAFAEHRVDRQYVAVLVGRAAGGTWDAPVDGKRARTDVEVVGHGAGLTAIRARLRTGRTHQVRVHAALAGTPVAGDRRYGAEAGRAWPRLALHAARLALIHPVTGQALAWDSPVPDDLAALWARAGGG